MHIGSCLINKLHSFGRVSRSLNKSINATVNCLLPLGPTMANFCLTGLEAKLLRDSSDESFTPSLYLRYVDDIFCAFTLGSSHEQFLDKLNCLHPNLKFTSEVGPSVLPYLDTTISLPTTEDGCFTSKVFRKRTYTGLI